MEFLQDSSSNIDEKTDEKTEIYGSYKIIQFIASGGQGSVYLCQNENGDKVILKTEILKGRHNTLLFEAFIIKFLNKHQVKGILQFYEYGVGNKITYLVQQYGGNSLQKIFTDNGQFNDQLILHILKSGLILLKQLQELGIIHQDIKPDNILYNKDQNQIYLIDFGMSKKIKNFDNKLMKIIYPNDIFGTKRFCSIAAINRQPQFTRDDLESFCYSLIYLQTSKLPWQNIHGNDQSKWKLVGELKEKYTQEDELLDQMCEKSHPIIKKIILTLRQRASFTSNQDFDFYISEVNKLIQ